MHPATLPTTAAILVLLHALAAIFFRLHTPAQWVAFAEARPRLARFIRPGGAVEHLLVDALERLSAAASGGTPLPASALSWLSVRPNVGAQPPTVDAVALEEQAARMREVLYGNHEPLKDGPYSGAMAAIDSSRTFAQPSTPPLEKWTPPRNGRLAALLSSELASAETIKSARNNPQPPTSPLTASTALLASLEGPAASGELRAAAAAVGPLQRSTNGDLVLTPAMVDALSGHSEPPSSHSDVTLQPGVETPPDVAAAVEDARTTRDERGGR